MSLDEIAEFLGRKWARCLRCSKLFIPHYLCKRCGSYEDKFCRKCHKTIDTKYKVGLRYGV